MLLAGRRRVIAARGEREDREGALHALMVCATRGYGGVTRVGFRGTVGPEAGLARATRNTGVFGAVALARGTHIATARRDARLRTRRRRRSRSDPAPRRSERPRVRSAHRRALRRRRCD